MIPPPRLVFWELTRRCNLRCAHCRAEASREPLTGELSTEAALAFVNDLATVGRPILVFTGGEPLYREDLFEIAAHAGSLEFPLALATNGTLITPENAERIREAGFRRASISLDHPTPEGHDRFRGIEGSFEAALRGLRLLRDAGVPMQVNTTVTRANLDRLEDLLSLAIEEKAAALHLFLLVPVGCGVELSPSAMISPEEYERTLEWIYERRKTAPLDLRPTCAPHFHRVMRQKAKEHGEALPSERHGMGAFTRGCLAGTGVLFVSHTGNVQPCGYLPLSAGNVIETPIARIIEESPLLKSLREPELGGKCGYCEFRKVCGGCRARAYGMVGDPFAEEPFCSYRPPKRDD